MDYEAVRKQVPLWIGLSGPSGGGKTFSAFRLATGIQRIYGGDIYGIDTESNRMLHYTSKFKFRHVPFVSPFCSLDYLAAVQQTVNKGAKVVIIDSMSHEHDGPGGCLEYHEEEVTRLCNGDMKRAMAMQMLAWAKPKAARRKLLKELLQLPITLIFCFRAKEKIKIRTGQQPEQLGFMPIAGEEFVFEMTANALLLPGAGGVPTWISTEVGEKQMIKLPEQFRRYFLEERKEQPLDEAAGEFMAKWAMGDVAPPKTAEFQALIHEAKVANNLETVELIATQAKKIAKGIAKPMADELREILAGKREQLKQPAREPGDDDFSDPASPPSEKELARA